MHAKIFDNQNALTREHLVNYAKELDIDAARVAHDLEKHVWKPRVDADFQEGVKAGVSGTPTFFINGRKHTAGNTYEALAAGIDEALGKIAAASSVG